MRYEIQGDTLPVVICYLDGGEKMITEKGAMSWMSPNMHMATSTNGGIGKAFGRMFSGESMFQNIYTAQGGPGMIAFASCFPGSILPYQISPGRELIVQKSGFLASEAGVNLSVFFQNASVPDSSAVRDLSCSALPEKGWYSWNLTAMLSNTTCSPVSRSSSIPVIWLLWKPPVPWISRPFPV